MVCWEAMTPARLGKTAIGNGAHGISGFLLKSYSFFERALGSVRWWWGVCLTCAAILAWSTRHTMNPDGLSYLDLASEALSGGPSKLVNGYWSPGYPALITLALWLFHPSSNQEFPLIHFVNFLIFVLTLWAFSVLLRNWLQTANAADVSNERDNWYVTAFAFSTFLWFTLKFIGMEFVTPDLGVAAMVFLAAGIGCRLSLTGSGWKHYAALGFVLGVGYYFKAAMFPLGLGFLAILFVFSWASSGVSRQKLLLSLFVFLLVAAPLLVALSTRANRLSFGESGRLNYSWYANGTRWTDRLEEPEPNTIPEHPAPQLLKTPVILEFASPIGGTYPLWYDPSYWYAGTKTHFDLRQQIAALKETLRVYQDILYDTSAYLAGAVVLFVLSFREKLHLTVPRNFFWQLTWPLAAFAMYAFVHVERRFLGAFFVLLWLAIYQALTFRQNRLITLAVCATVLFTVMAPLAADLAMLSVHIVGDRIRPRMPGYQTIALALHNLGLENGDRLAVVGFGKDCYYARCARLRVVAQIPDRREFWSLTEPELKLVTERLASIGVKAVVAWDRPGTVVHGGWTNVQTSNSVLSVLLVSPPVLRTPADSVR